MKTKNILPIIILVAMVITSCKDQIMEWKKDPTHGEISQSELPLGLAEALSRYQSLNSYTEEGFILGVGIGLSQYMDNETYRNLVNENFDEITVGYAMKHGAMVQSDGSINFTQVDALMTALETAGLSVFGHTLCWHSNQKASYMNGLIAPTIIPDVVGVNFLSNEGFEDGTINNWGGWGGTREVSADGEGYGSSGYALKLTRTEAGDPWSMQTNYDLGTNLENGKSYIVSFMAKATSTANIRVQLQDDSYASDAATFTVGTTWSNYQATITVTADGRHIFVFDTGETPATYYFDDVYLVEAPNNFIDNADFEDGTVDNWGGWGGTREVSADGEGFGGTGYAMKLTREEAGDPWSMQTNLDLGFNLTNGTTYNVVFYAKASTEANIRVQLQSDDYASDAANFTVGTTWQEYRTTITVTTDTRHLFVFDTGETPATYYFDNVLITDDPVAGPPTIVEMPDAEKKALVEGALEDWISQMMNHYKDKVHAWDVVNEPMLESGILRTGDVDPDDLADDNFYWVKYIGQDFGVQAFKLARQYGNANDILFINDYNLENSLAKCDGLIDYVTYIESQGATVDGIGTQMHVGLTTDKSKIVQMFQKLAATGKLIKISELDVRLGTANPTTEQLAEQAEMYRYIMEMYIQYIPAAQRYGVTIWGVSDNEAEHEFWLPDESPNLWDANYARKHAYKGVADGLAGKDVSEDFSGELEY